MHTSKAVFRCGARHAILVLLATVLYGASGALAVPYVGLAAKLAVLGDFTATNTGSMTFDGDLGVYPATSIADLSQIAITGTIPPDRCGRGTGSSRWHFGVRDSRAWHPGSA